MTRDEDLFGATPSGGPIGFDAVPDPDEPMIEEEEEEVAKERATVLYRREVERRRRRLLFLVLAGFTLYVVLLNLYKIHRMAAIEAGLELHLRHSLTEAVDYRAEMDWEIVPEDASSRPILMVDGRPLPLQVRCDPGELRPQSRLLSIEIPPDAVSGDYAGQLILTPRESGPDLLPHSFPIQVRVMSFMEEWGLLIGYLVLLLVILVALHLFNLYWYPAPRGFVTCVHFTDGVWGGGDTINLESGWAWLKSWRRSRVPLSRMIERRDWAMAVAPVPEFLLEVERIGVSYGVAIWLDFSSAAGRVKVCSEPPRQGPLSEGRVAHLRVRLAPGEKSEWYQVAIDQDWFAFQIEMPLFK